MGLRTYSGQLGFLRGSKASTWLLTLLLIILAENVKVVTKRVPEVEEDTEERATDSLALVLRHPLKLEKSMKQTLRR